MAKRLISDHAEDVGGVIVEPGDELPDDVDDDVVARLDEEGKLGESGQSDEPAPSSTGKTAKRGN